MKRGSGRKPGAEAPPQRLARGFVQTGGILQRRIRKAGEKRGFAETRLLTRWAELVGEEIAAVSRPVRVGYGKQGFGATLTVLTNGANAPLLQAQLPAIIDRVNACYGYRAISHIRLTQTSAQGLATPAPGAPGPDEAAPRAAAARQGAAPRRGEVERAVCDVASPDLRAALAALGQNILSRNRR